MALFEQRATVPVIHNWMSGRYPPPIWARAIVTAALDAQQASWNELKQLVAQLPAPRDSARGPAGARTLAKWRANKKQEAAQQSGPVDTPASDA